ncbi:hypothetical protein HQN90_35465 [Paenibacillus alba]|nr:hypothetical protein [Paenibacillus alba]
MKKPANVQEFFIFSSFTPEIATKRCIFAGIHRFWVKPSAKRCIIAGILLKVWEMDGTKQSLAQLFSRMLRAYENLRKCRLFQ